MFDSVIYARDKWLKPTGMMYVQTTVFLSYVFSVSTAFQLCLKAELLAKCYFHSSA
jgi:hypothetical protein